MWERIKEIASDVILIGYGLFFLWVFIWIAVFGYMRIIEPCSYILYIEIVGAILMIGLGIERLKRDIKK